MTKNGTFLFVNKSASDSSLSHSKNQEGLQIRRFIQLRNRRIERVRTGNYSPHHPREALFPCAPHRIIESANERLADFQSIDTTVREDYIEHCKRQKGGLGQSINAHSQSAQRSAPPSGLNDQNLANEERGQGNSTICRALWKGGSWSSTEYRGSEYFLKVIATDFTSKECLIFWNGLLPCILNEDVGIRLLVSGFAFMHELCNLRSHETLSARCCYREALLCCNRAISYIRKNAGTITKSSLVITCILIVSIEILRGNLETAKRFLDSGLAMSEVSKAELVERRWRQPVSPNAPTSFERTIEVTQAKMTGAFYVFGSTSGSDVCHQKYHPVMPLVKTQVAFSNLQEVNTLAEMLYSSTLRTAECLATQFEFDRASAGAAASAEAMQVGFENFHRALSSIRARGFDQKSPSEVCMQTMVQEIKVLEAQIVFNCVVQGNDEMAFDSWNPAFEKIVSGLTYRLRQSISDPKRLTYHPFSAIFIAPLWLVASRCRDSDIRRRAIHLLYSYRRRETVHDSLLTAKVAQRIVALEEHPGTEVAKCSNIILSRRVRLVAAEYSPTDRCIRLEYLQGRATDFEAEVTIRERIPCDVAGEWWIGSIDALLQPLLLYSKGRREFSVE